MWGDPSDAWDKLERACKHRASLADEIQTLIPYDPRTNRLFAYPVPVEVERVGRQYRFYADAGPALETTEASLILGDALFNLRSALDQIAFQLHVKSCRGNVPDKIERRSGFPILNAEALANRKSDTSEWQEIKALSKRHRRAIHFLQPYNTLNDNLAPIRRSLDRLNVLNNIDKHRHLHVLRAGVMSIPQPDFGDCGRHESFISPLEGKTEVFRWTFTTVPHDIAEQIQRYDHVVVQVVLDEPGFICPPLPLLDDFIDSVRTVVDRFWKLFLRS
jgi:hypothetical protein